MTEAEARARLERMVASTVEPVLALEDVDDLLATCRRPDVHGALPSAPEWVPTWDLDSGAATGWEWKAGRVSDRFDFSEDGQSFRETQARDACMAMAKLYRRGSGSVTTGSVLSQSPELG